MQNKNFATLPISILAKFLMNGFDRPRQTQPNLPQLRSECHAEPVEALKFDYIFQKMNILDHIRNFLNSKQIKIVDNWKPKENAVYFHEDLANQVEFSPSENLKFLKSENEIINDFAKDNFDGTGFTKIYERKDNPIKIIDKKIEFQIVDKLLLANNLTRFDEIYEGYGRGSWKCKNTYAYKFLENNRATIFIYVEDNFIKEFWIDGFRFHEDVEEKEKLKNILFIIGNEFDLILNDWDLCETINLKDKNEIDKYLNEGF